MIAAAPVVANAVEVQQVAGVRDTHLGCESAVDVDDLAGDVAGEVGAQEGGDLAEVVRAAEEAARAVS